MYLVLGIFWFIVGVGLLTLPINLRGLIGEPITNSKPLGALALVLSFYNLIRYRIIAARKAALDEYYAEQVKQRLGRRPIKDCQRR